MIPVYEMRKYLKAAYHNAPKWSAKVDKMPDDQVLVIFCRMQNTGKIDTTKAPTIRRDF